MTSDPPPAKIGTVPPVPAPQLREPKLGIILTGAADGLQSGGTAGEHGRLGEALPPALTPQTAERYARGAGAAVSAAAADCLPGWESGAWQGGELRAGSPSPCAGDS